ncbi:MAG: YARHG domain-containing protein [Clostridiales bacterium]|nr:YARHG domain-containing protein [Clostridiales bacterium]
MSDQTIFCAECGERMSGNSRFCPKCGAAVPTHVQTMNEELNNDNTAIRSSRIRIILPIIVIVAAALVFLFAYTRTVRINLNKYFTIEYDGYDGYGSVDIDFDYESFYDDYKDKIELKKSLPAELWFYYGDSPAESLYYILYDYDFDVDWGVSVNGLLSNGDQYTVSWNLEADVIEEYFNVKLRHLDNIYTVKGLEEVETVDVFEDVELTCTGASPSIDAEVTINSANEAIASLSVSGFQLSKSSGLRNGDTVTVSISDSAASSMAGKYGIVPKEQEKEYTIEGMDEYIVQLADLPDSLLSSIRDTAEEKIQESADDSYKDGCGIADLNYAGSVLFYDEQDGVTDFSSYDTELYVVYQVSVHEKQSDSDQSNDYCYYTYLEFSSPALAADGSGSIDLSGCVMCSRLFSHYVSASTSGSSTRYSYYGYETLSELGDYLIGSGSARYDSYDTTLVYDSDISDDETESTEEADDSESADSEYICSFSSQRLITDADMEAINAGDYGDLPRSVAQMMINEIYARNGCWFETEEVRAYFEEKTWYQEIGTYETDKDKVYNEMSQIEKDNIEYLKELI